jgi:16S rRNA processing protein RimM
MKQDYFEIGNVVKIHGIHGELILEAKNPDLVENIEESVFLEIDGLLVPFFITEIKATSKERFRIKFDWIDSESKAKKLVNCPVHLPLNKISHSKIDFEENINLLEGFLVIDTVLGELGQISSVIENMNNPLMAVTYKKREILIPIHPDLIESINSKKKTITLNCPEGLIDLFME